MTLNMGAAIDRASAVEQLAQGDVLDLPDSAFWLADAQWPLTENAAEEAGQLGVQSGKILVPYACDVAVMLTQTCDLQRTTRETPFCQVAPVIDASNAFVHEVVRGRRPGYAAIPWYDENSRVADLSRLTTLERSLLVGARVLARPRQAEESCHFAECVSRHFSRIALPDGVSKVLKSFLSRIRERNDRESVEGECIRRVVAFRVEGDPDLDAKCPDLRVLVVLEPEDLPSLPMGATVNDSKIDELADTGISGAAGAALQATDPVNIREAWSALAELWIRPADQTAALRDDVGTVSAEVLNTEELSFARSRRAPELDLSYLTSRAA